MSIAIITIGFMSTFYFIYEAIILPTIRLSLRFKLFALRDEIRDMILDCELQNKPVEKALLIQQSAINNSIKMLSKVDSTLIYRFVDEMNRDHAMKNRVQERIKTVEEYSSQEFQNIAKNTVRIFRQALIANMGAWFIYLVPIGICFFLITRIKNSIKISLAVPEGELGKVYTNDQALAW